MHNSSENEAPLSNETTKAEDGSSKERTTQATGEESSTDSLYDHLSRWDSYRLELRDPEIRSSLEGVDCGNVQVT